MGRAWAVASTAALGSECAQGHSLAVQSLLMKTATFF